MYAEGFWSRPRSLGEIRRAFRRAAAEGRAGVYLVGLLEVREILDASEQGWAAILQRHPELRHSPHLLRPGDRPAAVTGRGLLVHPPAPLSEPGPGPQAQRPARLLQRLLGASAAEALARGRYRRSRIVDRSLDEVAELLREEGHRVLELSTPA
ncbi:hypothetical protein CF15_05175 [Pyrodictium occultum]|uniref:Uncharacterized protein n=1 Tax=Pyrodictium occultum TaxID=2309 RepID=A0A0V8RVT1_PYROC|nr:hypothetical protein [Pyrodictium occultum]KSW12156.1 hypothetical protein CF15_05175 [Pyrodictium occultum]